MGGDQDVDFAQFNTNIIWLITPDKRGRGARERGCGVRARGRAVAGAGVRAQGALINNLDKHTSPNSAESIAEFVLPASWPCNV